MSTSKDNGIVLYHYSFSPFARRITWYLTLRGIPYAECKQPPILPRPDLTALGISYRRIPVMAIGRDIYCDTRLILSKLESLFPHSTLSATSPNQSALQKLLESWTIESPIFVRASQLIPPEMPLLKDEKFRKDREDFSGRSWDSNRIREGRGEALVYIRNAFNFLEGTLLADGREWVSKTTAPSLADIEAIWPFHWLSTLKGALPPSLISERQYPKVFAWMGRFDGALKKAKVAAPKPTVVKGSEATQQLLGAEFAEQKLAVDESDPLGLKEGEEVEVWPVDSGMRHRDRGRLLGLNGEEVVIAVQAEDSSAGRERVVRVHCPRTGFRVERATGASKL